MATTNGATKRGRGAEVAATRGRASTEISGPLSLARRRWMEAECAYRSAATRGLAVEGGRVETLQQLRDLAKAAEDAYCEALATAGPLVHHAGDRPAPGTR